MFQCHVRRFGHSNAMLSGQGAAGGTDDLEQLLYGGMGLAHLPGIGTVKHDFGVQIAVAGMPENHKRQAGGAENGRNRLENLRHTRNRHRNILGQVVAAQCGGDPADAPAHLPELLGRFDRCGRFKAGDRMLAANRLNYRYLLTGIRTGKAVGFQQQ